MVWSDRGGHGLLSAAVRWGMDCRLLAAFWGMERCLLVVFRDMGGAVLVVDSVRQGGAASLCRQYGAVPIRHQSAVRSNDRGSLVLKCTKRRFRYRKMHEMYPITFRCAFLPRRFFK